MKKIVFTLLACLIPFSSFAGDTTSLQGAWLLDETSGTRVDISANGNDLTVGGSASFTTGAFGNAVDLERSTSDYLYISDASQTGLDITSNYSVGCYMRLESLSADQYFISKNYLEWGFEYNNGDGGTLRMWHNNTRYSVIGVGLSLATTYHVAAIFNTTANTIDFYVDGSSVGQVTSVTTDPVGGSNQFVIGQRSDGSDYFDGWIDEAFVFTRSISSTELNDIIDNGLDAFVNGGDRRTFTTTF